MPLTKLTLVVAGSVLAAILVTKAQPAGKIHRIGYLATSSAPAAWHLIA